MLSIINNDVVPKNINNNDDANSITIKSKLNIACDSFIWTEFVSENYLFLERNLNNGAFRCIKKGNIEKVKSHFFFISDVKSHVRECYMYLYKKKGLYG